MQNADQNEFDQNSARPKGNSETKMLRKELCTDPQSKAVSIDRRKYQFSIRSLLLLTLIAALAVTSLLMYRRMADAERELVKLRNEAGYLSENEGNGSCGTGATN